MTATHSPSLTDAARAVDLAQELVDQACAAVRGRGGTEANQVVAYDVAHAAAAVATARATLEYGALGDVEARIAAAFVADVVADLAGKVAGREQLWGVERGWFEQVSDFMVAERDPAVLAGLAGLEGPRHLGEDFELVRETFHRFAEEKVRPHAEHVHRTNGDIPEEVIEGLAELGGFGLSVPEEYDGYASGGESDYMGMVVATEELSWGSLGRRGLAHHPTGDPDPGAGLRRDRRAEEALAAQAGLGRDPGRRRGDRAGLRLRRRRHRHLGHSRSRGAG